MKNREITVEISSEDQPSNKPQYNVEWKRVGVRQVQPCCQLSCQDEVPKEGKHVDVHVIASATEQRQADEADGVEGYAEEKEEPSTSVARHLWQAYQREQLYLGTNPVAALMPTAVEAVPRYTCFQLSTVPSIRSLPLRHQP